MASRASAVGTRPRVASPPPTVEVATIAPARPTRAWVVALALLGLGAAMLVAAWVGGNPLGRTPDEPAHVVKALAVGHGELVGSPATLTGTYSDAQRSWSGHQTRTFNVPKDVAPSPAFPCPVFNPTVSAGCQRSFPLPSGSRVTTYVGTYEPYSYAPAGFLMRLGHTRWSAWMLGRIGFALVSLGLLALAVVALWNDVVPPLALWGLFLAVTPTVVWLSGSVNPSAAEITAAICFTSGLLAITRPSPRRRGSWAALIAGGLVLATTRALGPYFVAAIGLLVLVARGRRVLEAVRREPRLSVAAAGVVAAGVALNFWWEKRYQPGLHVTPSALSHWKWERLPSIGREMVGVFGWLEWHMPNPVFYLWGALFLVLLAAALWRGRWTERLAIVAGVVLTIVVTLSLHSILPVQTGYDVYGRYVLPLAVAVPLLASDVVVRRGRGRARRPLLVIATASAVVVLAIQAFAWFVNARRFAEGTSGPRWFVPHAQWIPSGGWIVWITVAMLGVAILATAATMLGVVTFRRTPAA